MYYIEVNNICYDNASIRAQVSSIVVVSDSMYAKVDANNMRPQFESKFVQ